MIPNCFYNGCKKQSKFLFKLMEVKFWYCEKHGLMFQKFNNRRKRYMKKCNKEWKNYHAKNGYFNNSIRDIKRLLT